MSSSITVNCRSFRWFVQSSTTDFTPLNRMYDPDSGVDVLRITDDTTRFDIVIRIDRSTYADGVVHHHFGPLLVLGDGFPDVSRAVQYGIMLRLRPRIKAMRNIDVSGWEVGRIIQWCLSSRFRPVRINASSGLWRGSSPAAIP